jgi:hypothetical protein
MFFLELGCPTRLHLIVRVYLIATCCTSPQFKPSQVRRLFYLIGTTPLTKPALVSVYGNGQGYAHRHLSGELKLSVRPQPTRRSLDYLQTSTITRKAILRSVIR